MSRTLAVALILVLAGCGRSDSSDTSQTTATVEATQTTTETTQTIMSNALACLEEAGLSNVEERDVGVWGGLHHGPSYAIVVHKLLKPAEAPRVVAGEYAVTGSFKVVAVGRGLTGDEGIQADALVQTVADCLGG